MYRVSQVLMSNYLSTVTEVGFGVELSSSN